MNIIGFIMSNLPDWIFAILSFGMGFIIRTLRVERKKNEAIGNGVQALLRDRIIAVYNKCKDKGNCPIYELENVKRMYAPYHRLGGNDVATGLVEELEKMPKEAKEVEK